MQAIQNHKYSNILENIGEKDISSHVNFNDLKKIAIKYNLKIEEYCTQRNFLIKYGILTRFKKLNQSGNFKNLNIELKKLIGESEMGNLFKFLILFRLK